MTYPITPSGVIELRMAETPDEVFEAFNELITKTFKNGQARFYQRDVATLVASKMGDVSVGYVIDQKWLDVVDMYEEAGWIVKFYKPRHTESQPAEYTFTK